MFVVYILYSQRLSKFYTGFTGNLVQRLVFHNEGKNHFSKKGLPWLLITCFEVADKVAAMKLEKQIKKNGAKRYLERNGISFSL
jgi:putative endonuclease